MNRLPVVLLLAAGAIVRAAAPLARFEPERGCYLGAFIENDVGVHGDMAAFERIVGRRHAVYLTYSGYGMPFPSEWVERVGRHGAAAHLGWEPNNGLAQVRDDDYLRGWARAAAATGVPIFLRFASEMNGNWMPYSGNPPEFIRAWRTVAQVMREEAPNVAMVWCVYAMPRRSMPWYYPGDEWVDWVGVNLYSVVYHSNDPTQPASDEDPRDFVRHVYDLYADRKPIMIGEYAATTWCKVVGGPTIGFALDKMRVLYRSLAVEFPRVKCIDWFSWDAADHGTAHNNYSLTANELVAEAYRELTAGSYFLDQLAWRRPAAGARPSEFESLAAPVELGLAPPLLGRVVRYTESAAAAAPAPTEIDLSGLEAARAVQRSPVGLRGLQPGDVVTGPTLLRVYHPDGWRARMAIFRVNGGSVHATNRAPFEYLWNPSKLAPGTYELSVTLVPERGEPVTSPPVSVEVRRAL